jgi:CTP synthase (UTP-ammonia lyase)
MKNVPIALVGDFDETVIAHRAIPLALTRAARAHSANVSYHWLATDSIHRAGDLSHYRGVWCVPASPYRSTDGALIAIRHARENQIPFFGSCGGFQHAIIEYARHVLNWPDAAHAETAPNVARAVIAPLACALVEAHEEIQLFPNTKLHAAYRRDTIKEAYHCRYGLNPQFQASLLHGAMQTAAIDDNGEVRAVEIAVHPFFVATLFQPERAVLDDKPTPIVDAFVAACVKYTRE